MVSDMIDSAVSVPGQRVVAPAVKTNIPRGPMEKKITRVRPSIWPCLRRRRRHRRPLSSSS